MKICGSRCSLADPRPRQVSKEKKAAGAKNAAAMKKAGKGIFAPKTLSPALAAICGKKVMPRTEVRAVELERRAEGRAVGGEGLSVHASRLGVFESRLLRLFCNAWPWIPLRNSAQVTKAIWVYIKKKVRRFFSPMPVQNGVHVELILRRFDPNNALHKRETSSANGFRSVLTRRA